jgi:signal transduction histidine kinase
MTSQRSEESDTQLRRAAAHWAVVRHSVFAKLLLTMLGMTLSIIVVVIAFFWFSVGPNLHHSVAPVLENYTRDLAAHSLDLATAKDLAARLNIEVRFEGAQGGWTTSENMPSLRDVQEGRVPLRSAVMLRRNYYIAPGPSGGAYLFAWDLGERMSQTHTALLVLLVTVIVVVLVTGYWILKRFLSPVRTLNEGVASLAAGRLDVTLETRTRDEFGRLTEAFNHMAARVRAMIGARDQLLADVSHELRSPLTRLKVALELLPAEVERKGMEADIAEMERKVGELLELERLRTGKGLELVQQDLAALVQDEADAFKGRAPGVFVKGPIVPVWLEIDREKVRSVFRNLLENAFKYAAPRQPVEIAIVEQTDAVVVTVSDDGPGIPVKDTDRLFEPFYRADPSRAKTTGGYGLGLSICKRVMQAHGGDIVLDRSREKGATFVLTFPKVRTKTASENT